LESHWSISDRCVFISRKKLKQSINSGICDVKHQQMFNVVTFMFELHMLMQRTLWPIRFITLIHITDVMTSYFNCSPSLPLAMSWVFRIIILIFFITFVGVILVLFPS